MIDSPIRSLAIVAPPAPAAPPQHAAPPQVAAHPFAELLRQNRAAAATTAAPSTAQPQAGKADERTAPADASPGNESTPGEPSAPRRDAAQAKARAAGASRATPPSSATTQATPPAATSTSEDAPARQGEAKDGATAAPDPNLIVGAGALAPDVTPRADAGAGDAAATAHGPIAAGAGGARAGAPGEGPASGLLPFDASSPPTSEAAAGRHALLAETTSAGTGAPAGPAIDTPASASFAAALTESKASTAAPSGRTAHANDAATAAVQASGFVGSAAPNASNAVASAALPVAVHSPDFAAAFGVQVSVLAKDGVQRAELHLNPAEMGPVSIHITLDGSQARVDFGADVAATRHAIEAGLPELASALRDAGFTLAGGGVAQHSGSNGNGSGAGADRGTSSRAVSSPVADLDATAQRLTRRVSAGGLDLYA